MVQPYFENLKLMDSEVRSFSLNPPNAPPFASIFPGFVAARNLSFYELGHFGAGSVAIIKKDYRISFLAPNCSPKKKMPLSFGRSTTSSEEGSTSWMAVCISNVNLGEL